MSVCKPDLLKSDAEPNILETLKAFGPDKLSEYDDCPLAGRPLRFPAEAIFFYSSPHPDGL
jgi:hypothetical protein